MFCLRRVTPKLLSGVRSCFTRELAAKIRLAGPMSIAQYMQEVLTNPAKGYYTTKEKVIGAPGDFVTSPEISQMFGECIAIWIINEWRKMGSCKPLQLVELGPGHGTLMQDILRTIQRLVPDEIKHLNVHLVEASPTLIKVQEAKLCGYFHQRPESSEETSTHQAIAKVGLPVKWHSRIGDVPKGFTFFIANEFFDALPVHKFVKNSDSKDWEEVLVDAQGEDLRFVKAKSRTIANQYIDNDDFYTTMEACEISPRSGIIMEAMAERIADEGGAALIADYGYAGSTEKIRDTFRAFKNHELHDPLKDVGQADLTADVDFDYLKRRSGPHCATFGPVSQRQFLLQLGIQVRCNLLKDSNPKLTEELDSSLDMLINPGKMGTRFKFFCMFPKTMEVIHKDYPPAGFYPNKLD